MRMERWGLLRRRALGMGVVDVVVEIGLAGEPALLGTGFCWDISVVLATGCDIISGNVLGFSV